MKTKLMLLLGGVLFASQALFAETETVDGIEWTYTVSNGKAEIRNGYSAAIPTSTTGAITIPSELGGYPVTSIGSYAFRDCSGLTSVTIPNRVTRIGDYAFYRCSSLTSVTMPDTVTSIGEGAFCQCTGLKNVTIPDSVTSIGGEAFRFCDGLADDDGYIIVRGVLYGYVGEESEVVIPNSVTSISTYTFGNSSGLTSVTIPDSVTSIGSYAFYSCTRLTSVTIPDSVTSVGRFAFRNCVGLADDDGYIIVRDVLYDYVGEGSEVVIPNSVTSIGDSAFEERHGLMSVTIPDSVTSIGSNAFRDCSGLTSVTIGNSVTSIGDWAFMDCHGLMSVTISDSVTRIGNGAFADCSGLTIVTIPDSVTSIGTVTFQGCSGLRFALLPASLSGSVSRGIQFNGCPQDLKIVFYEGSLDEGSLEWVTVNLNANGGEIDESSVECLKGYAAGALPTPRRADYMFLGWFTAAEGGDAVTAETVVTADMTLYAHWGESPFSATGGAADWNVGADGSWRSGTITDGQESWAEVMVDGPCVLSFKWKTSSESNYDWLTLKVDGEQKSRISGVMGEWADYSLVIADSGSHTLRWTYSKDGSVSNGEDCGWVKDLATATVETRALLLDVNDGQTAATEKLVADGYAVGYLPVPVWGGEGNYRFLGWFTAAEGGDAVTAETVVTGDMTLYAHWGEIVYTYNYIDNGDGTVTLALYDKYDNWIGEPITPMPVGEITIPDEIDGKRVVGLSGDWVFYFAYKEGVTSIVVPAGVTNIVAGSLAGGGGSSNLTNITVAIDNPVYKSVGGIVYSKNGEELVLCPHGVTGTVQIPSGVRRISHSAFHECRYLAGVVFPAALEVIGEYAFFDCYRLTNVSLPASLKTIESDAFSGCTSLAAVLLNEGLESIQPYSFNGCPFDSITIPSTTSSIGNYAFGNCSRLATVTFAGTENDIDIADTAFVCTPYDAAKPFALIIEYGTLVGIHGVAPETLVITDYLNGQTGYWLRITFCKELRYVSDEERCHPGRCHKD